MTKKYILQVEKILNYKFKNKKLLEEALTHPSCSGSVSYQRLEFIGDSALGLAISSFLFKEYSEVNEGQLTDLRAANVSTEKFARVAVNLSLYENLRHKDSTLDEKVKEFVKAVQQEEQPEFYGGAVVAPDVLADIVESVAGAVFVDCDYDLKELWGIFRGLLEPIITLDLLEKHPITMLFERCQKNAKRVDIKCDRDGEKTKASIYIDGEFIVSASSGNKENASLQAARAALKLLVYYTTSKVDIKAEPNTEIESAKGKLHAECVIKKWPAPTYRIDKETGPAHDRRFICSAQLKFAEGVLSKMGEEKSRKKDAENSAASAMIRGLKECKRI